MARYARILSSSSIYHIMLRGINRTEIFFDDDDRERFIDTLQRMKAKGEYEIYAYCLMDNHIHLLIKEIKEPMKKIMKRIGVSYAYYINNKYKRVGHLFQDRYRSEAIEGEPYLLAAARYIHNNPVKAGMVNEAKEYPWSSYKDYTEKTRTAVVEIEPVISMFSKDKEKAVKLFEEYTKESNSIGFIDINEENIKRNTSVSMYDTKNRITEILKENETDVTTFRDLKNKTDRDRILREIKEIIGIPIRQLSIMLGVSKDIIFRA